MNFLSPTAFFLAILLPVIVLMYLLKLRRKQQEVSSIYLWERLVRDIEANAPWQKLTRNILMIVQLFFLLALIFAAAEPYIFSRGSGGDSIILIIDSSASMSATDTNPSRLEAAKSQARTFVNEAVDGARFTLIDASSSTKIVVSASQDKRFVHQAIDNILPGFGKSDLSTALQLTAAITQRQPNTDIYIFSDGKADLPDRLNLNGNLFYYPIGYEENNQGISNVQLRQHASGSTSTLFIQLTNYGGQPATRRLEIYLDDQLYNVTNNEIDGYAKKPLIVDGLPQDFQTVFIKFSEEDYLPLDDQAWAIRGTIRPLNLLLVTEGNRFLEIALDLLPKASLQIATPAQYEQSGPYQPDIVIFDSYSPPGDLLPQSGMLFIAPPKEMSFVSFSGTVEQPTPRKIDPKDPVLDGISINNLNILESQATTLPDWAKLSIVGDSDQNSVPLLFYGKTGGRKIAVMTFKLQHTDLPLQVAFPLLIANLVNWLSHENITSPIDETDASTLSFFVPAGTNTVSVQAPGGASTRIAPEESGLVVIKDVPPGIYNINWGEDQTTTAVVNFFSPSESDISPATTLNISTLSQTDSTSTLKQSKRVIWRPFALLALALLVAEWLIYHRGTLTKLLLEITGSGRT